MKELLELFTVAREHLKPVYLRSEYIAVQRREGEG